MPKSRHAARAEAFVRAFAGAGIGAPAPRPRTERSRDLAAIIESLIEQQRLLSQEIVAQRGQILAEVDRIAREVAEAAAGKAVEQLTAKLGLEELEQLLAAAPARRRPPPRRGTKSTKSD